MPFSAICRTAPVLALLAPALSVAEAFGPLPTYNQNPLTQIYGLPAFDSPRLLPRGAVQARLTFEAASHFISSRSDSEMLWLDGETHRVAATFKYGTGAAEWGIELPYLSHSGGALDSFIDSWHAAFGLPDGGRDQAAPNQLRYSYQRNGTEVVNLAQTTRGVGDIRLLAAWPVPPLGNADAVLRTSLKLPTGDPALLHGSGAADFAGWITAACAATACNGAWRWHLTAGAVVLGRGDILPDQQRRFVAFGGLGMGWRAWQPVILKAELRAHTPVYGDTGLAPLGAATMQLILGGTWVIHRGAALDVAVSEDIRVNTAPDVSLLVSLRTNF